MTIRSGDHYTIETIDQFLDRTRFDIFDIGQAIETDENLVNILEAYNNFEDVGEVGTTNDIPKLEIKEILGRHGVSTFKQIITTLEQDHAEWIHLYDGTVHDIVRLTETSR